MENLAPAQTILVVEDSNEDYEAIVWAMKKLVAPQKIYRCNDGDDALDYLHRRGKYNSNLSLPRPGLILLDLNLPGTDGREVLQQIKLDSKLKTLPIVVLTSSTNPNDIEKCYTEGANSYLRKPVNLDDFTKSLKLVLDYWFGTMERFVEGYISYRTPQPTLSEPALADLHNKISGAFLRSETRAQVLSYIKALISNTGRKNCWQLSALAGDSNPAKMQRLLSHAQWDAEKVRDTLQNYIIERVGHPQTVLVLDEVFFSKKGDKSAGVARQLNSHNGQIENGQVGVFLSYNSPTGDVLLDRELYLPPEWETDTERRNQTVIPDSVKYLDKAELGIQMLTRTLAAGVPFRWLAGSSIYGNSSILREWLNVKTIPYLFQIDPDQIKWPGKGFRITGKGLNLFVNALEKTSWETIKYQKYNQGQATFQWNYTRVEGLQSRTDWQTWLLVRRNPLNSKELSYYLVSAPSSTSLAEMVKVEEQLWVTNNLFKVVRAEVGLDQYEVRFWQGWYRHITLAMAAYLYHVTNQNQVLAGVGSYGK